MKWWLTLALAVPLAACPVADFSGDKQRIRFTSNLARPLMAWNPSTPVAVGTSLQFTAVDSAARDGGPLEVPPQAMAVARDPAFLMVVDAGIDLLTAVAVRPGASAIDWTGLESDTFTLRASAPARAEVSDPVLFRLGPQPSLELLDADSGVWEDVGQSFALAPGASLFLETVLRDGDGGFLAHTPGFVQVRSTGAIRALSDGFGVVVSSDGGSGSAGELSLETDAGPLGSISVHTVGVEQVRAVELIGGRSASTFVFKATGRLDGGAALWQAPVTWTVDPRFTVSDMQGLFGAPNRLDFIALSWPGQDAGTYTAEVTAQIGAASSSMSVTFEVFEPPADDAGVTPAPRPAPGGCGCGAGEGFAFLPTLLAALALAISRRRRDPERAGLS